MTHPSGSHTEERDQARAVLAASAGEWQAVPGSAELARVEAMTAPADVTLIVSRCVISTAVRPGSWIAGDPRTPGKVTVS